LVAGALRSRRGLQRAVAAEVRVGALASASVEEVRAVFSLWRSVLASFPLAAEAPRQVARALSELEACAILAARRWRARRIDLVTVGASAGGIGALSQLLAGLGADLPASVLIVLHVSEHAPSLLASVLS